VNDLEAIRSADRERLLYVVRHEANRDAYEVAKKELYDRDTARLVETYIKIMTGETRERTR